MKNLFLACLVLVYAGLPACVTKGRDSGNSGAVDMRPSGNGDDGGPNGPVPTKIDVVPASATIDIVNGDLSNATASFSAVGTFDDGSMMTLNDCSWTIQNVALGTLKKSTFNASGDAGGSGKIVCTDQGITGSATIQVNLHVQNNTANFNDATKTELTAPATVDTEVAQFLYPYEGTVFPRGIDGPELMWAGGTASDYYALSITEPGMDYVLYFQGSNPQRQTIPHDDWVKLMQTTAGGQATVTLTRLKGGASGTAYTSVIQHWVLSTANLRGSIYYWHIANSAGNAGTGSGIGQIKPGQMSNDSFIVASTGSPTQSHVCVACHSVSKDGSTIAASLNGYGSPWITYDISTPSVTIDYDSLSNLSTYPGSGFQAIYPDGSVIVWGQAAQIGGGYSGPLALADAKNGTNYGPSGLQATSGLGTYPAFSPDGMKLALAERNDTPSNPTDTLGFFTMRNTNLVVFDYSASTHQFSNLLRIKHSSSARDANVYPNFSPDSQWIAYQNGDSSSARPSGGTWASGGTDTTARADLRLISVDGTVDIGMDALSSGLPSSELHRNYEPTFNPVVAGGYFWVVFVSMRQYGNRLTNTGEFDEAYCTNDLWVDCRSKQLWVAAIDSKPQAGHDPSHPAFWLEGQDLAGENMRGSWALDPCKMLGVGCEAGFECCTGACRNSGDAEISTDKTCVMPQPGQCGMEGDVCAASSDCCNGEVCFAGTCSVVPN